MATYTSTHRKSFAGAFVDGLATFYRRRWLLRYFLQRQITRSYKRSYLGMAWAFLSPFVWVFFLALIFSDAVNLRYRPVPGYPDLNFGLYLYCGLLPFMTFAEAMNKGMNSIKGSSGLVQKVVFPMELLPFTNALASMVDKFFGFIALLAVAMLFDVELHAVVFLLPLIVVLQTVFVLGLTYIMAVLGTYLPDLGEVMRPVIRGTFFLTPILWPPERLPERIRWVTDYNPLAYLVNAYRDLILFNTLPGGQATLYFGLFSFALLVGGFALFVRFKWGFADRL